MGYYSFKNCLHDKTLYSRVIFQFSSLRDVTNLASEHRIKEAKLIRLCHTLNKNKKKKKDIHDKIHKLWQASSVLDKSKASSSLHSIFSSILPNYGLLKGDCLYFHKPQRFSPTRRKNLDLSSKSHTDCLSPAESHRALWMDFPRFDLAPSK